MTLWERLKAHEFTWNLGPFGLYSHHLGDYLQRWVFRHPLGDVKVHRFQRADADEELHDHPWDFVSLVLSGGYTEVVPVLGGGRQEQTFRAGCLNLKRATDAHRIVEVLPSTWTLLVCGRKVRTWGFWTSEGWVTWQAFEGSKQRDAGAYERRLREVGADE